VSRYGKCEEKDKTDESSDTFSHFLGEPQSGHLELVDGSQRLRTLEEFLHGEPVLGEFDKLSLLSGFGFGDLSEARQRRIKIVP